MRKFTHLFLAVLSVLLLQNCSSQKLNRGEQIIEWINEHQKDSLRAWVGDEFSLYYKDKPVDQYKDTGYFLGEFIDREKFMHGKTKITKSEYEQETKAGYKAEFYKLHVSYTNLYQDYLGIKPYKAIITIEIEQDKISAITFEGEKAKEKDEDAREKIEKFQKWMKEKYPAENFFELLKKQDELAIRRLEEYKRN